MIQIPGLSRLTHILVKPSVRQVIQILLFVGAIASWVGVPWASSGTLLHSIVDALAISAALLGLALALQQMTDTEALRQNTTMLHEIVTDVSNKAERIAESTSTSFLAIFPANVEAIVELVLATQKRLSILCDVAGYAHFSDPDGFLRYRQALESQAYGQQVTVQLIVYDNDAARRALHEQLGAMMQSWPEFVESHKAGPYARKNPDRMKHGLQSADTFAHMIEANEMEARRSLAASGVRIGRTARTMPFYVWISDDKTAIISFIAQKRDALEYSFRTSDPKLIDALRQLVDDGFNKDTVVWDPPIA